VRKRPYLLNGDTTIDSGKCGYGFHTLNQINGNKRRLFVTAYFGQGNTIEKWGLRSACTPLIKSR
jgi:hypothetical protein